jgi:hypothetical protein
MLTTLLPVLGRSKQCMLDDKATVFVKPAFVNVESLKDSEYKVFRRCVKVCNRNATPIPPLPAASSLPIVPSHVVSVGLRLCAG